MSVRPDSGFDPETGLYPSERNDIIRVMSQVQNAFMGKIDDLETMFTLRKEATERFAEIGFEVHVDFIKEPDLTNGRVVMVPEIELIGRVNPIQGIDHDRMRYEVQGGLLDGVEGSMKTDGSISEPSKIIL